MEWVVGTILPFLGGFFKDLVIEAIRDWRSVENAKQLGREEAARVGAERVAKVVDQQVTRATNPVPLEELIKRLEEGRA